MRGYYPDPIEVCFDQSVSSDLQVSIVVYSFISAMGALVESAANESLHAYP